MLSRVSAWVYHRVFMWKFLSKTSVRWILSKFKTLRIVIKNHYRYTYTDSKMSLCSRLYRNNTLKVSHSWSSEFSSYLSVKFVLFLKSRLLSNILYCFCLLISMSHISNVHISKSKRFYNVKLSVYYFYVKMRISADFHFFNCYLVAPRSTFGPLSRGQALSEANVNHCIFDNFDSKFTRTS